MSETAPKYDALTLDTNIFFQNGYNLEGGILAQLQQFKEGSVEFVLSEVVMREVQKHMITSARGNRDSVATAMNKAERVGLIDAAMVSNVTGALIEPADAVNKRLNAFATSTGLRVIKASGAASDEILRAYFRNEPPFEATGKKKEEFPDAFALFSLQKWASSEGKRVLAVSDDQGWSSFAEGSQNIDVTKDLPTALAMLQQHVAEAAAFVQQLLTSVENGSAPGLRDSLEQGVSDALSEAFVDVEVDSPFHVETDQVDLEFKGLSFQRQDNQFAVTIVRIGQDMVAAKIGVLVEVEADAWFSLSVHDSIDDDYVNLGGANVQTEAAVEESILVSFSGVVGSDPNDVLAEDVSFTDRWIPIDFGYVELDYRDEPEEYADLPQLPFDDPVSGAGDSEESDQSSSSS